MATENQIRQADAVYKKLCGALDQMGWTYDKNDEDYTVDTGASGEDFPISIFVKIDVEKSLVFMLSKLPFEITKDARIDASVAISAINNSLVDGSFDYNLGDGTICYRMTVAYHDSALAESVFSYMIYLMCKTVDDYNGQLYKISTSELTVGDFIEWIRNK